MAPLQFSTSCHEKGGRPLHKMRFRIGWLPWLATSCAFWLSFGVFMAHLARLTGQPSLVGTSTHPELAILQYINNTIAATCPLRPTRRLLALSPAVSRRPGLIRLLVSGPRGQKLNSSRLSRTVRQPSPPRKRRKQACKSKFCLWACVHGAVHTPPETSSARAVWRDVTPENSVTPTL